MSKKRILLVDDDIAATRLLKIGLEKTGQYEVKEENSATRVLSTARSFKPDLAVLDVCMPNLDGGSNGTVLAIHADGCRDTTPWRIGH